MRLDLPGLRRQLAAGPLVDRRSVVPGALEGDLHVGVGQGRELQVAPDAVAPALVAPLELDRDARPASALPFDLALALDHRLVAQRVDRQLVAVGGAPTTGSTLDDDRLAGGQLAVHSGGADADPLLAPALPQPVELGAVEELAEDLGNLCLDDAGSVVGDLDPESVLAPALDAHGQDRQDPGLLTGVEGVVHRFLDRRQESLRGAVEAQQMAVLGEELADRDLALLRGHGPRGGPFACRLLALGLLPGAHSVAGLQPRSHHQAAIPRATSKAPLKAKANPNPSVA